MLYPRILRRIQKLVKEKKYIMTEHAAEEMEADDLTIFDVESAILTGKFTDRQRDSETREWKYVISGQSVAEDPVGVISKLTITDKVVIITVYAE